jgi:ABC-type transporter Mla subunit MlaD
MAKEHNNVKAGAFILVSAGLIVAVIFSIQGVGELFATHQERTASFRLTDDLGGLQVGDEVRLGGFKVGVVKGIDVRGDVREFATAGDEQPGAHARAETGPTTSPAEAAAPPSTTGPAPADATRLLVTFTLPARYDVREDAVVTVQTTITGTASLNISSLGIGRPASTEVALLGRPSGLNALLATLGDLAPELEPAVREAKGTITEARGTMVAARDTIGDVRSRVVPNLADALERFKGAGGHLEDLLGDTKGDIRGTMANLKDSTGTLKEKLPTTMDNANKFIARLDETVKNTEGTLADVKAAVANFKDVSASAREIVGGNKGKLDSMIASLKTTGDNLKAASSEIRHSPWRLLYKPGKGEMANLNLYDSARQFADGAGSLNDAALALRDALENKEANPEEIEALLGKLDQSFANFREVEDKLWTLVKE